MNDIQEHPYVTEFLVYLQSERGLSIHTIDAYRNDLRHLQIFLEEDGRSLPPELEDVVACIQTMHKKPASIARFLSAVKRWYLFLFREKYIKENIGSLLETPLLWQTLPQMLSAHDIQRFIAAPGVDSDEGIRDTAILEVLYGTGIRVSELCHLSMYDVNDTSIKVLGKGSKERVVPLGKCAIEAVEKYLLQVRPKYDSEHVLALFVVKNGSPISRQWVWRMIKKYGRQLGVTSSPHTFRHTYASHLLDNGADPRIIQELLGHANISSTDRYTHVAISQVREVFRTFHPRWKKPLDE